MVYLLAAAAAAVSVSGAWPARLRPTGVFAIPPVDQVRAGALAAVGALAVLGARWPRATTLVVAIGGIGTLTVFASLGMYGLIHPR